MVNVGEILAIYYNQEIGSVTRDSMRSFGENGTFEELERLVMIHKKRQDKEDNLSGKIKNWIWKYSKRIALPTLVGSLVGAVASYLSPNTDANIYEYVRVGAECAFVLSTAAELLKQFIPEDTKISIGRNLEIIKEALGNPNKIPNFRQEKIYAKLNITDSKTNARKHVLRMVSEYAPCNDYKRNLKATYKKACLQIGYGIFKYVGLAVAYNFLMGETVSTQFMVFIGAFSQPLYAALEYFDHKKRYEVDRDYRIILKDLTDKQRHQLIGGLISRWYFCEPSGTKRIQVRQLN